MSTIVAINNRLHAAVKIAANPHLLQSKSQHFAPLVVQEFVAASQEFPIVFIKDADTGQFKAIALLGLKPGENLFIDHDQWQGSYRPQALTLYPFLLHQEVGSEQAVLCFDSAAPLMNSDDGEAFFDEHGKQTAWLAAQGERVVRYVENSNATEHFIKRLLANELLVAQTLNLTLAAQQTYALNGLYVIDQQKLNGLSNESFLALRASGALPAIYAALFSMQRVQALAHKKLTR